MSATRAPHAVLDLPSRLRKALKIERLLGLDADAGDARMLEIGTGSGGIANYFGAVRQPALAVESVDVVDSRQVAEGYRFTLVAGTALPFADGAFDIVLSNHVIEHVGDAGQQRDHLREMRRVLGDHGVAYLAVPNRWMLVEPHYKLAFLSWLPRCLRSRYLRLRRGVAFYDCEPLSMRELETALAATGWRFENVGVQAASEMRRIEPGSVGLAAYDSLPRWLKTALLPLMPTLIYRLRKAPSP